MDITTVVKQRLLNDPLTPGVESTELKQNIERQMFELSNISNPHTNYRCVNEFLQSNPKFQI